MRLDSVHAGDIVQVDINGERIYGTVADTPTNGEVAIHPLRRARGDKVVSARQVVGHWRKRKARAV